MTLGLDIDEPAPTSEDPVARAPNLEILWPTLSKAGRGAPGTWEAHDEPRFPDPMVIRERRKRDDAETHAPTFKACVSASVERVLIMDPYLLCAGRRAEDEVLSWFPEDLEACDVRIMCGGLRSGSDPRRFRSGLADAEAAVNRRKRGTGARLCRLQARFSLDPQAFPFLHDRFAIVDLELWHFGSTVGGLHNAVNAATRGWDAAATGAVAFFDSYIWTQPAGRRTGSICDRRAR